LWASGAVTSSECNGNITIRLYMDASRLALADSVNSLPTVISWRQDSQIARERID
jgi:hypothetical protein